MKVKNISVRSLLLFTLFSATFAVASAEAQEEAPGTFGEVIDVRVVNLEVVVTEDGNRVSGLGPEDFILRVDGREVPIEYFTEVSGGTAVPPDAASATVPALAPGEDVGTSYLVFVDEYFARSVDRDRILKRMVEQLPNLGPADRMAVVAFDGKKVEMLSTWSQSQEELRKVFRKALERPAHGLQRESERRIFSIDRDDRALALQSDLPLGSGLDLEERQLADLLTRQVEKVVLAASSSLRSFANPPGRKVMLLLSGGWPYNPAYWVVNDPERVVQVASEMRDGERLYRPLVETANRLSYTLYTVDLPGVDTVGVGVDRATVDEADLDRDVSRDRELDEHLALRALARDTGGRALVDGAAFDAFQRVAEDTRSYYWLGFTPSWKGDDADHRIEVDVRRKGLKVRSRRGFSDLSRESEVTMMVESALLFGNPPSSKPLGLAIGPPEKAGRSKVIVPLRVVIPTDGVTFLPQGEKWLADTELRIAVLDERGETADIPVLPLGIRLDSKPEEGRFTFYDTRVKLRKQPHDLVVSVYDKASGRILSVKAQIDPEALMKRAAAQKK